MLARLEQRPLLAIGHQRREPRHPRRLAARPRPVAARCMAGGGRRRAAGGDPPARHRAARLPPPDHGPPPPPRAVVAAGGAVLTAAGSSCRRRRYPLARGWSAGSSWQRSGTALPSCLSAALSTSAAVSPSASAGLPSSPGEATPPELTVSLIVLVGVVVGLQLLALINRSVDHRWLEHSAGAHAVAALVALPFLLAADGNVGSPLVLATSVLLAAGTGPDRNPCPFRRLVPDCRAARCLHPADVDVSTQSAEQLPPDTCQTSRCRWPSSCSPSFCLTAWPSLVGGPLRAHRLVWYARSRHRTGLGSRRSASCTSSCSGARRSACCRWPSPHCRWPCWCGCGRCSPRRTRTRRTRRHRLVRSCRAGVHHAGHSPAARQAVDHHRLGPQRARPDRHLAPSRSRWSQVLRPRAARRQCRAAHHEPRGPVVPPRRRARCSSTGSRTPT